MSHELVDLSLLRLQVKLLLPSNKEAAITGAVYHLSHASKHKMHPNQIS